MPRSSYNVYETDYPYFITCNIVGWEPLFAIPEIAKIVLNSLVFHQNQRSVVLYAYVIMENHIYLVLQSDQLSKRMRTFKSYTARRIIDYLNHNGHTLYLAKLEKLKLANHRDSTYQVWQEGYHPKQIIGDKMLAQKIQYIHQNPVKRGYIAKAEHWRYSSAQNYLGKSGLIPVSTNWYK